MTRHLVFIDGDDRAQIDWMVELTASEPDRYKVILTNGAIVDLMKALNQRLFFDQNQVYTKKMDIKSLPALVYQSGLYLRIDEVAIP
jgi:conjugal transfer pilus assembly protein TraW